jgi:steroid 5-alpha reductase family enzyme
MAERSNKTALAGIVISIAVGAAISWAGSDHGERIGIVPVFALCGFLAFAINWLAFIPSAIAKTEHFYDLVGGITYITVTTVAVQLSTELDVRTAIVAGMVLVWSLRLATFLFRRISKAGQDSRFDTIKTKPLSFLMAWTMQGLWVLLTASAALAVITSANRQPLEVIGYIGITIWIVGFVIEVVADHQKSKFKADPANEGKFIDVGLLAWSRHPNFFG